MLGSILRQMIKQAAEESFSDTLRRLGINPDGVINKDRANNLKEYRMIHGPMTPSQKNNIERIRKLDEFARLITPSYKKEKQRPVRRRNLSIDQQLKKDKIQDIKIPKIDPSKIKIDLPKTPDFKNIGSVKLPDNKFGGRYNG